MIQITLESKFRIKMLTALLFVTVEIVYSATGFAEINFQLSSSVIKVVASSGNNKTQLGSGVVVDHNLVATNCHVMRRASNAHLLKAGKRYPVIAQSVLSRYDVCILKTRNLDLPSSTLNPHNHPVIGEPVVLFGYPLGLGMRFLQGTVQGLHLYQGDHIIEVNTGFLQGASGGGVFNQQGQLIGLATFMSRNKDNLHFFVIPANWIKQAQQGQFKAVSPFREKSFWEKGEFTTQENITNTQVQ
ncbi:MAG: serine protease [Gammaproteobacteria bacterium]|nr:serine protease [Gammaproteobacteria bacterium]